VKCEYCRRTYSLAVATCKGCGAPLVSTPAIMYDWQVFDGQSVQYLFRPGMNIDVNMDFYRERLADYVHFFDTSIWNQ
jgi:hypothetical protein